MRWIADKNKVMQIKSNKVKVILIFESKKKNKNNRSEK